MLRLPANASPRSGAQFFNSSKAPNWVDGYYGSMSCPSLGNCAVVGAYGTNGGSRGVLMSEVDGRWTRGIERPLPADALKARPPRLVLNSAWTSVSCGSPGNCTAIGFYWNHGAGDAGVQGLLVTELNGTWGSSIKAPLPVDAYDPHPLDPNGGVELESVSCTTAGSCTGVGSYQDDEIRLAGVLLTETNGQWARGVRARLPVGVRAARVTLKAVSCASPGNCTAIGSYNGPGHGGLLLTQTDGQWATGVTAPLPSDHGLHQYTPYTHLFLNSVSCSSPGNCTAVGNYVARGGHQRGLMLTQTDGVWAKGAEARLPAGAWHSSIGPATTLKSVSCPSAGNCTAAGAYVAGKRGRRVLPLLLSQNHGRWAKGITPRLPRGAAPFTPYTNIAPDFAQGGLFSVSCPSAGNCTAVGQYPYNRLGAPWGLRVTQSHGGWGRAVWVKG